MQSRSKAVIAGLLAGAITWNFTRVLPYGFEAGGLAAWSAVLADLDSAWEFAGDHAKYPPATQAVPFGRSVADRLHSRMHVKFLHSIAAVGLFWLAGTALAHLPPASYARMELVLAAWVIFAVVRYLFHTILRHPLRSVVRVSLALGAGLAWVMWEVLHGRLPGYRMLPVGWFMLGWVGGFAGNVTLEALSTQGVPLLWPLRWRFRVPLFGETGGLRDGWVVAAFLVIWLGWWWNHYPSFHVLVVDFELLGVQIFGSAGQLLKRWL